MEVLYILIPLALLLAALIIVVFFWAIKSGQFEDLEGPAWEILMDDDKQRISEDKNSESLEDPLINDRSTNNSLQNKESSSDHGCPTNLNRKGSNHNKLL